MKKLIQYHVSIVRLAQSDFDYMNGIAKKILPLIDRCSRETVDRWRKRMQAHEQCLKVGGIEAFEQQERYLRILHFGCGVHYWSHMESPQPNGVNCTHKDHAWVHYAYLKEFEREFNESRDYFRKKLLYHDTIERDDDELEQYKNKPKAMRRPNHDRRDWGLLDRYMGHMEIKFVRNKVKKDCNNWIYTRSKIDAAIETILNNACELTGLHSLGATFPLSIELDLKEEDVMLVVKVKWEYGITELLKLHRFQADDHNVMRAFAIDLCTAGRARVDRGKDSGANADKYIQRIGIYGPLEKFIERDSDEIRLKKIDLKKLSATELEELCLFLTKLEFWNWDF